MDEASIFLEALQKTGPEQRAAYLDQACAGNAALRREVEMLLKAHAKAGEFLNQPAAAPAVTVEERPTPEAPGQVIGPYKLLQQIGEGGMGVVYLAEQEQPIRRKVALKIIKPGMDSRQVLARFEAERQALALMDHQNIARVLDAATTTNGRPYFVMELVKGVPITKFCDENHLTPHERLELFVPVCQAIQHAHQKGIIHRDVKPSNVLVTLYDGRPVPKVIDFGVAKALDQRLTERTLFTQLGQVVGTLEYMSPEQAEVNALDIDTRSDIYALGVLLYELLTGSTPLDKQKLRKAAFSEMLRMIREEEPPRPSTRLSASAERLPSISAQRKTEPAKLAKLVRGELDWLVMKALEKDRARRYETANGFARDVQRYLADEPVEACPPSAAYRLGKFVRKNRKALATAGTLVLLLMALAGGAGWVLSDRSARQAETERVVNAALDEAAEWQQRRRLPEALSAVRRADGLVRGGTAGEALRRRVQSRLADLELLEALDNARLEGAAMKGEHFEHERTDTLFGAAFRAAGLDVEGLPAEEVGERLRRTTVAAELAAVLDEWALIRRTSGAGGTNWPQLLAAARAAEPGGAAARVRDALRSTDRQALVGVAASEETRDIYPPTLHALARALEKVGAQEAAIALLRAAQGRHPDDFWINETLALALQNSQPPLREESIRYHTAAISLRPGSEGAHINLGAALWANGDPDGAMRANRAALQINPKFVNTRSNLGNDLKQKGDLDGAIREYRAALQIDPKLRLTLGNLVDALCKQRDLDGALRECQAALRSDPDCAAFHCNLASVLQQQGRFTEALAANKRGHELGLKDPGWRWPSAQWVREAEQFVALDGRLPQFLTGAAPPADAAEQLMLAECLRYKKLYAAATRSYAQAVAAKPELGGGERYEAACAAALAGCGQGQDAASLNDRERARLRQQALDWLRADLVLRAKQAASGQPKERDAGQAALLNWQRDPYLAGVRGDALARLPEADRDAWRQLWAEVADTVARAQRPGAAEKKPDTK
jgi:serine/threonine protein kinase/tetratricopeptide (TPR) repeat protein